MKKSIFIIMGFGCLWLFLQGCGLNPNASESWKNDLPKNAQNNNSGSNKNADSQSTDAKKGNTLRTDRAPQQPTPIVPILGDGKSIDGNKRPGDEKAQMGTHDEHVRHLKIPEAKATEACGAR